MNSEDHPKPEAWNAPDLEARIVAWVAGEASAFEVAELERLVRENPELAVFKRRIEAVHGLVAEAARPDSAPLRLSDERRAKLLATLSATRASPADGTPAENKASEESATVLPFAQRAKKQRRERTWILGLAACAAVGLFTAITFLDPGLRKPVRPNPQSTSLDLLTVADAREQSKKQSETEVRREERSRAADADDLSARRIRGVEEERRHRSPDLKERAAEEKPAATFNAPPPPPAVPGAPVIALTEPDATVAYDAEGHSYSELTPFDVKAEQDKGYAATNTLAGSRMNTQLRDVSSSITVATPEFLKDTGATNAEAVENHKPNGILFGMGDRAAVDGYFPSSTSWNYHSPALPAAPARQSLLPQTPPIGGKAELSKTGSGGGGPAANAKDDDTVVLNGFVVASDRASVATAVGTNETRTAEKENRAAPRAAAPAKPSSSAQARVAPQPQTLGAETALAPDSIRDLSADKKTDADLPLARPAPPPEASLHLEISAAQEPFSTLSLHVSDVSFRLAQKALASGQLPDPATLRAEEFYNAFNYGEPAPAPSDKIACRIEQAAHPSLQQRNLVRIAAKVPSTGRGAGTPLRLTVLLDTSGSMEREDRSATVRAALHSLATLLGPNDRLTLIGFARQPRLLAEAVAGDRAHATLAQLGAIPADGGTNLEEALKLGTELALRHFEPAAQNRVVLLTDGAANLGNADPASLSAAVEKLRAAKVAFDACGVGLDGLDDSMLEALTRRGDGRYYVLDSAASADAGFARQLAGAFRPAAANVKLQVRFNPSRVGRYRLLGFEKHRLRTEDFRNDAVDAAELAADEAAIAVYQVEALPQGEGELGDVFVRFRDPATGEMVERSWTMTYDAHAPAFDRATPALQLAGTAALFAELLRDRPTDLAERLDELAPTVNALRGKFANERRVQEFAAMFEQARRLVRR